MFIMVVVTGLYTFAVTLSNVHLKLLNHIVCKLDFNKTKNKEAI